MSITTVSLIIPSGTSGRDEEKRGQNRETDGRGDCWEQETYRASAEGTRGGGWVKKAAC